MAHGVDPTKCQATGKFLPRIRETLDGWRKQDPATQKELPVEVDVPEYLVDLAYIKGATEKDKAVADLVMIAFITCCESGNTRQRARDIKPGKRAGHRPSLFASKTLLSSLVIPQQIDWFGCHQTQVTMRS